MSLSVSCVVCKPDPCSWPVAGAEPSRICQVDPMAVTPAPRKAGWPDPRMWRPPSGEEALRGTIIPAQLPAGARRTGLSPRCQAPVPDSGTLNKTLTPGRRSPCFIMCPLSRHPKPASRGAGEGPGSLRSLALCTPSCRESRSGSPRLCMCAWWGPARVWWGRVRVLAKVCGVRDPFFLLRGRKLKLKELNESFPVPCFTGLRKKPSMHPPCRNLVPSLTIILR